VEGTKSWPLAPGALPQAVLGVSPGHITIVGKETCFSLSVWSPSVVGPSTNTYIA